MNLPFEAFNLYGTNTSITLVARLTCSAFCSWIGRRLSYSVFHAKSQVRENTTTCQGSRVGTGRDGAIEGKSIRILVRVTLHPSP